MTGTAILLLNRRNAAIPKSIHLREEREQEAQLGKLIRKDLAGYMPTM
jgi:hypothetical protein